MYSRGFFVVVFSLFLSLSLLLYAHTVLTLNCTCIECFTLGSCFGHLNAIFHVYLILQCCLSKSVIFFLKVSACFRSRECSPCWNEWTPPNYNRHGSSRAPVNTNAGRTRFRVSFWPYFALVSLREIIRFWIDRTILSWTNWQPPTLQVLFLCQCLPLVVHAATSTDGSSIGCLHKGG